MVMPFLVNLSMIAVVEPIFAALLRLAGGPARLPRHNEDFVWF